MGQIIDLKNTKEQSQYENNLILILSINPQKLNYSIKELSEFLGFSYEFIRESIHKNKINALKFGDRYMIHVNEVARLLTEGL